MGVIVASSSPTSTIKAEPFPAAKLRAKRIVRTSPPTRRSARTGVKRENARAHYRLVHRIVRRGSPLLERQLAHLLLVLLRVPAHLGAQERVFFEVLQPHPFRESVLDRSTRGVPVSNDTVRDERVDGRVGAVEVDSVAVDVGRGRIGRRRGDGDVGSREDAFRGVFACVAVVKGDVSLLHVAD
jgi:hypothetical protein